MSNGTIRVSSPRCPGANRPLATVISRWPVAAQTGLLGTLHMTACAIVYLGVGVLARTALKTRPSAARAVTRVSGAMMIVIGGFLLVERPVG